MEDDQDSLIATFSAKENTCYAFQLSYRLIDVVEFRSRRGMMLLLRSGKGSRVLHRCD